jgi:2-iminoacetate synthase ThiH
MYTPFLTAAGSIADSKKNSRMRFLMQVHAFSPLEVSHGASSLGASVTSFLQRLRDAGLGSLPGTAAEILTDRVRSIICPDKLNTAEWLEVVASAHGVGLKTTSTIMFGHVDTPEDWAAHLLAIRYAAVWNPTSAPCCTDFFHALKIKAPD